MNHRSSKSARMAIVPCTRATGGLTIRNRSPRPPPETPARPRPRRRRLPALPRLRPARRRGPVQEFPKSPGPQGMERNGVPIVASRSSRARLKPRRQAPALLTQRVPAQSSRTRVCSSSTREFTSPARAAPQHHEHQIAGLNGQVNGVANLIAKQRHGRRNREMQFDAASPIPKNYPPRLPARHVFILTQSSMVGHDPTKPDLPQNQNEKVSF